LYDPNVGFYYLRARYYDQTIGRFVTTDPWQGNIFEPATLHRYLYANANPLTFRDPTGQFSLGELSITMAIGGIINSLFYAAFNFGNAIHNPEEFWKGVGVNFAIGALTAPVGGFLTKIFGPIIKGTLRPLFQALGRMGPITARGRTALGKWLVGISRIFINTNRSYPQVGSTTAGKILIRMFPNTQWHHHHILIRQAFSRPGSAMQLYDDVAANEGLRRVGNSLFNLIPLPESVHAAVHSCPIGPQILATAYYSIITFGSTQTIINFWDEE
jgi:RHS repeat-associated protein